MRKIILQHNKKIQHYFRKGNGVADVLAKYGTSHENMLIVEMITKFNRLPRESKGDY